MNNLLKIRLTPKRLDKISDILSDLGLISVASVVLPAGLDKIDTTRVVLGLSAALICWTISLGLRK